MPPANPPQENGPSLPFSSPPGYGLPPDWGNPSPAPIGPQVWPPADAPSQQLPSPSTIPLPSLPPLASPSTPPAPLATPPPFTPTPPTSAPQSSTPPPLNGVTPPPNGVEGPKPTGGQPPTVSSQASGAPPPQSSPPVFAAPLPAPGMRQALSQSDGAPSRATSSILQDSPDLCKNCGSVWLHICIVCMHVCMHTCIACIYSVFYYLFTRQACGCCSLHPCALHIQWRCSPNMVASHSQLGHSIALLKWHSPA